MFFIVDKKASNFLSSDEAHSFTNHIGHALQIEDEGEARAMLKGAKKVMPEADLALLAEVE